MTVSCNAISTAGILHRCSFLKALGRFLQTPSFSIQVLWQQEHCNERFVTWFSRCGVAVANAKPFFKWMKAFVALVVFRPVIRYHQRVRTDSQLLLFYLLKQLLNRRLLVFLFVLLFSPWLTTAMTRPSVFL